MLTLTTEAAEKGPISDRIRLLTDCRTVFRTDTALPTLALLERLKADPEAPWHDYGPTGLTPMKLGAILREYDIRSGNIRFPNGTQAKGYQRTDFTDTWNRYCPLPLTAVPNPTHPQPGGVAVPAVPASKPQVNAGRLEPLGRLSRPNPTSRPSLTSTNEPGTAGTATPLTTDANAHQRP